MGIRLIFLNLVNVTNFVVGVDLNGLIYAGEKFQEIAFTLNRPYRKPTLVGR